ncbi:putative DBINO protein [Hordeum vulgare]|nr:putative DBINO protein [Hordeum vulgare]
MADAHPNSGGPTVDQPGMAKKKKAKAPRKPLAECTPEEIVKLDAESAKRRNRRAVVKDNAAARKFAAKRDAMEAARRKAEVEEKEAIVNKAHALLMLGICCPTGFFCIGRRPGEHRLVGRPVSALPVADVSRGDGDEDEGNDIDISGEPLFIDELTQRAEAQKRKKSIHKAFQSLEAFKTRYNEKPFTLTHCWTIINICPKFKDQYCELQRKRGKKTAKFAGGGDGEVLRRPRGKTNSKVDDTRDAASMALHETLHVMMYQKDMRDEKKRQSKDGK